MTPIEQMLRHASVREFDSSPLPDEHIREAVRAGQQASTSSHVQAYALLQIEDSTERKQLRELCGNQAQVSEAGAFFIVCADTRRHRLLAERAGMDHAANLETFLVATIDASLFAQNLCLAFESQGYGLCYIGGLRNRLPEVDALLAIPEGVFPLYGLCVGVPRKGVAPTVRPRLQPEAVWSKGRYPQDADVLANAEAHDAVMAEEYEARGLNGRTWSGGVVRKFRQPTREHLAAYYASKGARLS
ncbi:MAG: nitroreductase family protein [Planctomycetota bacterium]